MSTVFFEQLSYIARLSYTDFVDYTKPSLQSGEEENLMVPTIDRTLTPLGMVLDKIFIGITKDAEKQGLTSASTDAECKRFLNSDSNYKTKGIAQSCLFSLAFKTTLFPVCFVGQLLNQDPDLVNERLINDSETALQYVTNPTRLMADDENYRTWRSVALVQLLISKSADINSISKRSTPLFAALQAEHRPLIKCFLIHGGKIPFEEVSSLPQRKRHRLTPLLNNALREFRTAHWFVTHRVKAGVWNKIAPILRLKIWSYLAPEILHVKTAAWLL